MRRHPWTLLAPLCLFACSDATPIWEDASFRSEAQEVARHYAAIVAANYEDSARGAEQLHTTLTEFTEAPSEERLHAARAAWLGARDAYGLSEVYRFYGGPIDAEPDNLEGRINAWPMDESYIDYVEGDPEAGIINDLAGYPTLDRDLLIERNAAVGEDSISTGWHAIEFLLWGQDLSAEGPGARPWTDFADAPEGTASNQERRRQYLTIVSELLIDDLHRLADAWSEGQANYRAEFVAQDPRDALTQILLGMGSLSGAELAGERMTVAYDTREQEDEHSCFSDNTHKDLLLNIEGIQNVYLGKYGDLSGPGISALVARLDPELDASTRESLQAAVDAVAAIPPPFDVAIQAADGSPERKAVADAIQALRDATTAIVAVADKLEITLNLEE